jgi:hypothetical protein
MVIRETASPRASGIPREVSAQYAVLEASPNAIVAADERGRLTYANPQVESTFGYASAEIIGEPIELLLPERLANLHLAHRKDFLAHPVARPMGIGLDLAGRRKDGSEFPVEISLSPVETADGLEVFATVVDITARRAMQNQLLQAQKLESIGRLAGGIAHDFNNMLFAIRGYSEILAEDLSPDRDGRFDFDGALRSVAAIASAADRASLLTSQLLAFSRRQIMTPRVIDVNAGVRGVEPMLRRLIGENLRLVLHLDPSAGRVRVDPGQLDQVLVNLVVNARDAMPGGGTVTIQTANVVFDEPYTLEHFDVKAGPFVLVAVSDTGVGMDRETREHIFEPFFTTKEQGKGTGLGLATIYGIVHQAAGHIWLYSEPGLGSTFKLYFPLVDTAVEDEGAEAMPEPPVMAGTVMVVEDEPAVRDMTTLLLGRAGYEVISVADATEALARMDELAEPIDVLVADVIMPDMSGLELAEKVMDRSPQVRVVLLSGYTAETLDLGRVIERGATFVPKPISSGGLLRAIREASVGERSLG